MNTFSTIVKIATPEDVPAIFKLLSGFAKNQGVDDHFTLTEERLYHLITEHKLNALLAYHGEKIVGTITFYETISTFSGQTGLYIEDMYIRNTYQRQGIGKVLLDGMIDETKTRGYAKLEWQCPKNAEGAIHFYKKMGAKTDDHWRTFTYSIK